MVPVAAVYPAKLSPLSTMENERKPMALPKPPFHGSCLCGAVHIKISAPPLLTFACHCHDCQKLSASAYSLTTMFPKASFSCTGELSRGGLLSSSRAHYFCKLCLNFIYSQTAGDTQHINLRTSVLSEADSFPPFVELMTDRKMTWAHVPATHSFPRYIATLADLQALMESYSDQ